MPTPWQRTSGACPALTLADAHTTHVHMHPALPAPLPLSAPACTRSADLLAIFTASQLEAYSRGPYTHILALTLALALALPLPLPNHRRLHLP